MSPSERSGAAAAAAPSHEKEPPSVPHKKQPRSIAVLPRTVVDQIAAGEVVQRPVSVVKELLENSLDAGSTHIVVHVEKGGLSKLSMTDNGCGIPKDDLTLAAQRHATSKLSTVDDFDQLSTFGFRGEALASISMVSRLTITTRTSTQPAAYRQTYQQGVPVSTLPQPCARKTGTTILVQDLFANVPHRMKLFAKRESDEYQRILTVMQHYAIHYPHCGFVCQRKQQRGGTVLVDLNTSQLSKVKQLGQQQQQQQQSQTMPPAHGIERTTTAIQEATRQIIAHVLEPSLEHQLGCLTHQTNEGSSSNKNDEMSCGFVLHYSKPAHQGKKSHFILFVNHRLMDLTALKRSLEGIYTSYCNNNSKSTLIVHLTVPGNQVDVNVHPSKRQVALMFQDEIIQLMTTELQKAIQDEGHSFVTAASSTMTTTSKKRNAVLENPYAKTSNKKRKTAVVEPSNNSKAKSSTTKRRCAAKEDDDDNSSDEENDNGDDHEDNDEDDNESSHGRAQEERPARNKQPSQTINRMTNSSSRRTPPSRLIRTAKVTPVGAIEPFLTSQQTPDSSITSSQGRHGQTFIRSSSSGHVSGCPLAEKGLDMSQPGAFALAQKCICDKVKVLVQPSMVRLKKVVPTVCSYNSIASLRKKVNKHADAALEKELRDAYFVGVVSQHRSLIQCGEQLVMINHYEMGKELFYQLALARFGGPSIVPLNESIDMEQLMAQALQLEDEVVNNDDEESVLELAETARLLDVSAVNQESAKQAAQHLLQQAEMLLEYFGIRIEQGEAEGTVLTGLPALLEGHIPASHALPLFLLRLTTGVEWTDEKHCFRGVCEEIGRFYATVPLDNYESHVQHVLFPALSYLLLPSQRLQGHGSFKPLTKLSTVYKVFERC